MDPNPEMGRNRKKSRKRSMLVRILDLPMVNKMLLEKILPNVCAEPSLLLAQHTMCIHKAEETGT